MTDKTCVHETKHQNRNEKTMLGAIRNDIETQTITIHAPTTEINTHSSEFTLKGTCKTNSVTGSYKC